MIRKEMTIRDQEGLQSRGAALLVQVAGRFTSSILIEQASKRVNAKSIMGVLSLRLREGDTFTLTANGADEAAAIAALEKLINTGEA